MWDRLKCWLGLHAWVYESHPGVWQETYVRRACRRCPKKQARFENQAKLGRVEWIDLP